MPIFLTRPLNQALPLKTALEAAGKKVVLSPLLTIEPRSFKPPAPGFEAVIATSSNGFTAEVSSIADVFVRECFVVGPFSEKAARAAGFKRIHCAQGDADSLIDLLVASSWTRFLYFSGTHLSKNIPEMLALRSLRCERVITYEACGVSSLSEDVVHSLETDEEIEVVMYSERTMRLWGHLTEAIGGGLMSGPLLPCTIAAL